MQRLAGLVFVSGLCLAAACGDGAGKDTDKPFASDSLSPAASDEKPHGNVDCSRFAPDATIEMRDLTFVPDVVSVPSGGIVRWENNDTLVHNVSSGIPGAPDAGVKFDSGKLAPGEDFCVELSGDVEIPYYCKICPEMRGSIIVGSPQ